MGLKTFFVVAAFAVCYIEVCQTVPLDLGTGISLGFNKHIGFGSQPTSAPNDNQPPPPTPEYDPRYADNFYTPPFNPLNPLDWFGRPNRPPRYPPHHHHRPTTTTVSSTDPSTTPSTASTIQSTTSTTTPSTTTSTSTTTTPAPQ